MTFPVLGGGYTMNVTIAVGLGSGQQWTSREVPLKATTKDAAMVEAKDKARRLMNILVGNLPLHDVID